MDNRQPLDILESSTSQDLNLTKINRNGWFSECSKPTANEVMYLSQIILIFIVMLTSLYNLSNNVGDSSLWTALLTSCLGYILPNPKIKSVKIKNENIY